MATRMTWPQLRDHATACGLVALLSYTKSGKAYRVWVEDGGVVLEAVFTEGHAHGVEFARTYLPTIQPRTGDSGHPVVTTDALPTTASNFQKSFTYTSPAGVTSIFDERINGDMAGPKGLTYLKDGEYRVRGSLDDGSSLEFAVVDRDDVLGVFALVGATVSKMENLTAMGGGFAAGSTVRGKTSGETGVLLGVGVDSLDVRADHGNFTASEVIEQLDGNGNPDGNEATLSVTPVTEGSPYVVRTYVTDEWIETGDKRSVDPGGSVKLLQGLYLRTKFHNANTSGDGKVKVLFHVGKE